MKIFKRIKLWKLRQDLEHAEQLRQRYSRDYQFCISVHANMQNLEAKRVMAQSGLDFYTREVNGLLKQIKDLENELV